MNLGISGRVAFVSGGSKGMGAATAAILAAEGCKTAIVARDRAAIDATVERLRAAGGDVIGVSADLVTAEGVASAVQTVRDHFGPPEIVIMQTNDTTQGNFFDISDDDYLRVFETFTLSAVRLARAVLPDMRERRWGRIVHIGSTISKEPQRDLNHILHNTIRPSTTNLLKSLANEFARDGITINSVGPGYILTDTMREFFDVKYNISEAELMEWLSTTRGIPSERPGRTEEVASVIAFLCSENAGYLNGEFLAVDGGLKRSVL